ncbi:hypothetical protein GUJ93_ZPchr0012g21866 [Zizania palustris]|uniref:Protein kinase domain-containing protein n=1 Tax=Zizania palustris TaxID=103762 RepID=A0A8J6BV53_ZIZPA|nr:hypothetical protein GUJ93_ZPchr0012g21866 [Zizania palustris]
MTCSTPRRPRRPACHLNGSAPCFSRRSPRDPPEGISRTKRAPAYSVLLECWTAIVCLLQAIFGSFHAIRLYYYRLLLLCAMEIEIGDGVSATVYKALCIPLNTDVAIKVLDLEKCNNDLDGIRREVQTMSLIAHPNLLRAYCSFTNGHQLWVVMPYMAAGSALHIMKTSFPDGFEETVIATLLREVLKALIYLHSQGHIHRDVKAGNILIDTNGAVKLADFGVSACMFDTGNRQRARNTFAGTPCWMAPEVMQQLHGYDYKADIWSFGITALELAHGHAPFSKYPPMKVLLMTLQNAPPGLDYERDKRFSKSFKDLVATCLVKDPRKRPSSEKLLKHSFFKHARSAEFLARSILDGLPPLGERFRALKVKEADLLLSNKLGSESKEQLSQKEYIRGISGWNFNLEDLKNAAALIDSTNETWHLDGVNNKVKDGLQEAYTEPENIYHGRANHVASIRPEGEIQEVEDLDGALPSSFPSHPLEALKSCFDVCGDDDPCPTKLREQSNVESVSPMHQFAKIEDDKMATNVGNDSARNKFHQKNPCNMNRSGPLFCQVKDSVEPEEPSEGKVVQRRGRFQVASSASSSRWSNLPTGVTRAAMNPSTILPILHFLMQQNTMQKDVLSRLISSIEETSDAADSSMIGSSQVCTMDFRFYGHFVFRCNLTS